MKGLIDVSWMLTKKSMKNTLSLILVACYSILSAQHPCAINKARSSKSHMAALAARSAASSLISHENKYDVKFVHLDLNVQDYTKTISGNVKTVAKVVGATLDTFMCVLHQDLNIDSIYINGSKHLFIRQDSMVK